MGVVKFQIASILRKMSDFNFGSGFLSEQVTLRSFGSKVHVVTIREFIEETFCFFEFFFHNDANQ